jgi:hypothetical protein
MILRFLGPQGIAGLAVAVCLALLLVFEKGETRRWRERSAEHERLYRAEQGAFAATVANYRAAAEAAHAAELANAVRVAAEQRAINERTEHEYEARLAAARSLADRLRNQAPAAASHPGRGGAAAVRPLPASPGGADQAARQNGLSYADRLIATEQAIQLDEVIKWVRAQAQVDNGSSAERSRPDD